MLEISFGRNRSNKNWKSEFIRGSNFERMRSRLNFIRRVIEVTGIE